jgi:hypothetical protein
LHPVSPARAVSLFARALSLFAPLALAAISAGAQRSLAPPAASGETVTPVYEGWYRNKDGTLSLSFGYFNRNTTEVIEIPIGPSNMISPGVAGQGQPTTFHPRRHWGVFAVQVPAAYLAAKKEVVWTIKVRGQTFAVPGTLHPDWEIDALEGEASADNTPPRVSLFDKGVEGQGPGGITVGPLRVAVGASLPLSAFVTDDAKTATPNAAGVRVGGNIDVVWFKHQGPGAVAFGTPTSRLAPTGGTATTTATFAAPGEYVIRVRLTDSSVSGAGHSQCCWTNGFIRVTVTP